MMRRWDRALPLLVGSVLLAACSSAAGRPAGPEPGGAVVSSAVATAAPQTPDRAHAAVGSVLSPPGAAGIVWRAEGSDVQGRPATYVAQADAGSIGLLWIDPSSVSFRLVPGLKVPEGGPALPADNRPSTWLTRMVAAFNGGFMLKDKVGGYFYAHHTVSPLVAGLGALEITTDGRLTVGRWGRDLRLSSRTVVVRENLPLLVDDGRSQVAATDTVRTWGIANGGLWTANRSALGELADGSLVYAYGHDVRPAAMAQALVRVGVQRAMVLDMNKSWPGGFVYWHTPQGLVGQRIQPMETHAPSVYQRRYTKDFIVVQAR